MKRKPAIDYRCCTDCESCIEICPSVFFRNPDTLIIDVVDLQSYPFDEVEKAISICPGDCIYWEQ